MHEVPKRFTPVSNGVRSPACKSRTPSAPAVSTNNRFHHLEIEESSEECVADEATATEPQIIKDAAECHVSNTSVASAQSEHDLLGGVGKSNGRHAVMLIDSGSTHDFIAESYIKKNKLPLADSTGDDINVTLADGSVKQHRLEV